MTTPEIIDQIHELILEDHRISAKSIAEQLCISRERTYQHPLVEGDKWTVIVTYLLLKFIKIRK